MTPTQTTPKAKTPKATPAKSSWLPFAAVLIVSVVTLVGGGIYLVKRSLIDGSVPAEKSASNPVTTELPEKYPRGNETAPEFNLINQNGKSIKLADFRGRPLVLTFAFAHCTTMCPGVIQTVKSARVDLGDALQNTLFITIDPEHDKPETLAETASKWEFTDGMHFLSGEPALVSKVLDAYKIPRQTDGKSGEISHPALVYVIDENGKLAYTFSNPTKRWVVDAVKRVSAASVN